MNLQLPPRVQAELQAAEALEAADLAARSQAPLTVLNAADLVAAQQRVVPPPVPAPVAQPPAQMDSFEQKYKTLQGMYSADVTKLRGSLAELAATVQSLQAKEVAQPERPPVDTNDIEKFGEEMMEMVQRYVTGAVSALEARFAGLEATLTGVTAHAAETEEEKFYSLLTVLSPGWETINEEHGWLVWLGVVDKVYGVPRQKALDHAFKLQDAKQVAAVFNAYSESLPTAPVAPTLNDQITPDGAGNPTPPTLAAKPILSSKAITDFYNDVARGRYQGRQAEHDATENEINIAIAEGRVR